MLLRIHLDQGISHHILDKGANVYLSQHEPQRIRFGITKHHELVSRRSLEEMELVCVRSVIDKLVVSSWGNSSIVKCGRWEREKCTHRPESFLIMLRNESTTPYTSFASSSKGSASVAAAGFAAVGVC